VIEIMDTSNKLLAYLYQERVIGEIDYHNLRNESEMTSRNALLMDIIMRGSERHFRCLCECLESDVNQAYLVPCLQRGADNVTFLMHNIFVEVCVKLCAFRKISLAQLLPSGVDLEKNIWRQCH